MLKNKSKNKVENESKSQQKKSQFLNAFYFNSIQQIKSILNYVMYKKVVEHIF